MKILKIALRPLVCAWIGYCIHECMTQGRPTAAMICVLLLASYSIWVTITDLAIEKLVDEARKEIADFKKQYANDDESSISSTKEELITINQAVRVFGDAFPTRRQQMGKFERALRKAYNDENIDVDVPAMSTEA